MCVHLPTRHNVLQSQSCRSCECVLTGDVGYIVHSLRWNHVCFQDTARADSGLVVQHGFHPARLKLVINLEATPGSH